LALPSLRHPLPIDAAVPLELGQLLHAPDSTIREAAWESLIARHTRLILAAARSLGGAHDVVMGRYAYVLEKLREQDFHRLRAFHVDGGARFSTWLTVTARRLCLDHHRARYGRSRPVRNVDEATALRQVRRQLTDSISVELDTDLVADAMAISADQQAIAAERLAGLTAEIESLSEEDQLLLVLRFHDDLPASRISGMMGFPTQFHVYRRLKQVLGRLRRGLDSRGIENSDD
jgi:RNA polymerase sigma factor (sigma-70 family)